MVCAICTIWHVRSSLRFSSLMVCDVVSSSTSLFLVVMPIPRTKTHEPSPGLPKILSEWLLWHYSAVRQRGEERLKVEDDLPDPRRRLDTYFFQPIGRIIESCFLTPSTPVFVWPRLTTQGSSVNSFDYFIDSHGGQSFRSGSNSRYILPSTRGLKTGTIGA